MRMIAKKILKMRGVWEGRWKLAGFSPIKEIGSWGVILKMIVMRMVTTKMVMYMIVKRSVNKGWTVTRMNRMVTWTVKMRVNLKSTVRVQQSVCGRVSLGIQRGVTLKWLSRISNTKSGKYTPSM